MNRHRTALAMLAMFTVTAPLIRAETLEGNGLSTIQLPTITTASSTKTNFSVLAQTVTLRASVSVIGGSVNTGTVSFQLRKSGNNVGIAAVSDVVLEGNASAKYTLPAGLALGEYTIQASYIGSNQFAPSADSSKKLTIRAESPDITSASSATGVVGLPFSYTIQSSGTTPVTFTAQPLPAGLSISGAVISGRPTTAGKTFVLLKASNVAGSDYRTLAITINAGGAPSITSPLQATGTTGTPFIYIITASGSAPMSFDAENLPSGLAFDAPSATIYGTPDTTGDFPITLSASNSSGADSETLTLSLLPSGSPEISSPLSEFTKVGLNFSYTITAAGQGPVVFGASNLPAWLTFADGVLSGTPQAGDVGISQATLTASNANGTDTQELSITVAPNVSDPPVVTGIVPSRNPCRTNSDVQFTVDAVAPSGQPLTYSWFFFVNGVQDGPPLAGATVSRSFALEGAYTVVAIAFDGFSKSANFMKLAVALDPNSGSTAGNVAAGFSALNPLDNLVITVPGSQGGVVDFNLQDFNPPSPGASYLTRLPGLTGTFDSAAFADKFSSTGIYVVESVLTEPGTKDRKTRMMIPVGRNETGDTPINDDRTVTGLHSYISKGRFGFGRTLDTFSMNGSFELPTGMAIDNAMPLWIGMSNVTGDGVVTSRGKVTGLQMPFQKVHFIMPRHDRSTGKMLKGTKVRFFLQMKGADLSAMGFDTDGIARLNGKASTPRSMQFAMVIGGIPYYFQTQVQYTFDPSREMGKISGRR